MNPVRLLDIGYCVLCIVYSMLSLDVGVLVSFATLDRSRVIRVPIGFLLSIASIAFMFFIFFRASIPMPITRYTRKRIS